MDGHQDVRVFSSHHTQNSTSEVEEREEDYMLCKVALTQSFELDPKRKTIMKATEGKPETKPP